MNDGTCIECGRPTKNPRFCGRTCAARYNNRKNPKRRPEGKCRVCGSPIVAAKRLCCTCRQRKQEERQNIQTWKSPTGDQIKRQVPAVNVMARVIFDIWGPAVKRFTLHGPSGPFLEALIGLCYARPPYIRAEDVPRYGSLVDSLMRFRWSERFWEPDAPTEAVQDIRLARLGPAIRQWIRSFFDTWFHPLMATYALDAACFINAHATGKQFSSDRSHPALIPAMIGDGDGFSLPCTWDSTFKRELTAQNIGGVVVVAQVPEGAAVVGPSGETVFDARTRFVFQIARCHLSTRWTDGPTLLATESDQPEHDIAEDMWVEGCVLPRESNRRLDCEVLSREQLAALSAHTSATIPVRWITHAEQRGPESDVQFMPVPSWQ